MSVKTKDKDRLPNAELFDTLAHLMGKEPRNYTSEEAKQVVDTFSKLPLKELRRRQDLTYAQLSFPHDPLKCKVRYEEGITNLLVMQDILMASVDKKCFGT